MTATPPLRQLQWRMLLSVMVCYLFYYTGRQNFGFAAKYLREDLALSATAVGWISAGLLLFYGIGQAINGNLGDRFGGRRLMSLGAVCSVILNWVASFGQSFWAFWIPWSANGYFQSLGWAPGSRLLTNWWPAQERGRAFGLYVFAAGFSSILTFGLCLLVLQHFHWRWVFRLPVLLLLVAAVVFFWIARDRPEEFGYSLESAAPGATKGNGESAWQRYAHALRHGKFLLACLSIGCESVARYGLLFWVPVHYLGPGWKSDPGSVWITLALPVGMALGALSSGYLSDRFFGGNRSRPIALFLTLAGVTSLVLFAMPTQNRLVAVVLLFLVGFFVYGPQSSFWALCPDLLGRSRAGTGVGLMDASAYGFAAVGEVFIGWLIDTTGQTSMVFALCAVVCLLGAGVALLVRR